MPKISEPHAPSHEDGGGDELVLTGMVGAQIPTGRLKSATETFLSIPSVEGRSTAVRVLTANRMEYYPILIHTQITIDQMIIEVTTAGAGGTVARLGIYNADRDWQPNGLVLDAGTVAVDSIAVKIISVTQVLPAGRYILVLVSDGTPTIRHTSGAIPVCSYQSALGTNSMIRLLFKATVGAGILDPVGIAWDSTAVGNDPPISCIFLRVSVP